MTTPIIFQAKAMAIRLAVGLTVIAAVSLSFHATTQHDSTTMLIPLPGGAVGPESFAFDGTGGGPYTGVSDGRIIRWVANESRWEDFAVTSPERDGCGSSHDHSKLEHICGRPLGLQFNRKTGDLYIADAYMGLLVVGPNGGPATPLANGSGFGFTNSLDIDETSGAVYFTDSSTRFPRRDYVSIIISGDDTGRLMRFEPKTKKTILLMSNLKFPNGIALSKNNDFLLFTETTTCRLFKYWLRADKAGKVELVAEFNGFPDNIRRNKNGEFWVGLNSRRGKLLEWIVSNPWFGNALIRFVPLDFTKAHSHLARIFGSLGMGIRLDENGNVIEVLDRNKGRRWRFVSEVEEWDGNLWIGSVVRPFVIREKIAM